MSSCYKLVFNFSVAICLMIASGCFRNYYKIKSAPTGSSIEISESIKMLQGNERYFILRCRDNSFYLKDISLNCGQDTLSGLIDLLPGNHKLYITNGPKENLIYKKRRNNEVLSEVHIYIQGENSIKLGRYTLPTDSIQKIEVIEKDRDRTTMSYVVSSIGIAVISLLVLSAIFLRNRP